MTARWEDADADDYERLRFARALPGEPYRAPGAQGSAALVGHVVTGRAAGLFCRVHPVTITGVETEGGAGTLSESADSVEVYLFTAASTGDYLICTDAEYRWVSGETAPAAGCTGNMVTFNAIGCNSYVLPGVTINFNGTNYTTNSLGKVVISNVANGTYSYTYSKSRFVSVSGTVTVTSCNSPSVTKTLSPDTGYHCQVCFADPLPDTLKYSDSTAGVSAQPISWSSANSWLGCGTSTARTITRAPGPPDPGFPANATCSGTVAGTVPLALSFIGAPGTTLQAATTYNYCNSGGTYYPSPDGYDTATDTILYYDGSNPCNSVPGTAGHTAAGNGSLTCISAPFTIPCNLTFSAIDGALVALGQNVLYPGHTSTITVTE